MKTLSRIPILLFAGSLLAGADPLMGTWKAIPGSNTSSNGPQNIVLKYEATDAAGEVKFTLSGERSGQPYSYSWTAKPDGRKYPVEGQSSAQQIEFQRPAQNHAITIHFRDGQEIARHDATISADGKVMTTKTRAKNREGEVMEFEAKYEK